MDNVSEALNKATAGIESVGLTWLGIACAVCIIVGIIVGWSRGFVKEVVSLVIVFITFALVWFLNPYVNRFIREVTPLETKTFESSRQLITDKIGTDRIVRADEQTEIIEELELPKFLKDILLKNNNADGYKKLNVSSFIDYISEYIAELVVNGTSFFVTYIIVTILLGILVFVLDIFTRLPVINGINKLGGALLGGAKYVVFIWLAMLVVTVLCNTSIGRTMLDTIEKDRFLQTLYSWNVIFRYFVSAL